METKKPKFISPVIYEENVSLDVSVMTSSFSGIGSGDINIDELEGRYIEEN